MLRVVPGSDTDRACRGSGAGARGGQDVGRGGYLRDDGHIRVKHLPKLKLWIRRHVVLSLSS